MVNKTYTVVKDSEELKELKTLAAAKKLAGAEGAEVYSDGKCVYQGVTGAVKGSVGEIVDVPVERIVAEDEAEPEKAPVKKSDSPAQYRLKALMNVRMSPNGRIVKTLPRVPWWR